MILYLEKKIDTKLSVFFVAGDLNIIYPAEHSSVAVDHINSQMLEMSSCFNNLGVFDLWLDGPITSLLIQSPKSWIGFLWIIIGCSPTHTVFPPSKLQNFQTTLLDH